MHAVIYSTHPSLLTNATYSQPVAEGNNDDTIPMHLSLYISHANNQLILYLLRPFTMGRFGRQRNTSQEQIASKQQDRPSGTHFA